MLVLMTCGVVNIVIYYHKYNYLKYRCLLILYKKYPEALTARQIAEELGVRRQQVADLLSRWHKRGYGYCKRSKIPRTKSFKYRITEKGTKTLLQYQKRIDCQMSLNMKVVKKVSDYIGIGKVGSEQGLTIADAIVEMKKRKESRDIDK